MNLVMSMFWEKEISIRNCLNFRAIKELPMRQKHSVTKSVKHCTLKGVEGNHAHGFNI